MERKFLDIITTSYLTKRMKAEAELEKAVNSDPFNNINLDLFVSDIMSKVHNLKEINSDAQMWENIVAQLTKNPNPEKE